MMKHIRKPCQAMVEFALILPLLLLVVVGIFEFGRVMFIYSNLFNAAREGVRYGVTNPKDYVGIETHASDKVSLVNTADATFILTVAYDTGPGTATFTDYDAVVAGNRVLVSIQYDLIPMTPLLLPIVSQFPLNTQAARTIQTVGTIITTAPPTAPPDPPDEPSISLSPTCGPTGDDQTIVVSGNDWTGDYRADVYFDGGLVLNNQLIGSSFTLSFSVDVTSGDHTVLVRDRAPTPQEATATYTSPCAETPTETETETPTETETETPTETETETPTETETAEPTPVPITISDPVLDGNTVVSGTAETGQTVTLRVIQTGYQKSVVVGPGNHFEFTGVPAMVAGYTIIVQGYGQQDTALVQGTAATPTPTPTPTPLPTTPYLVINSPDPACGPVSSTTPIDISVSGFNFTDDYYVTISFDGVDKVIDIGKIDPAWGPETFSVSDLSAGTHVIRAEAYSQKARVGTKGSDVTIDFLSPCATPDLIVTGLTLLDTLPLTTYQKINVEVCVANQGGADVPSLFWVDLFADTDPDPLTFPSVDYVAVNGLPAGASISFTMWVEAGFPVTGTHTLIALADTWDQINEADETNNPSDPLSITLDVAGTAPTPTPTPSVTPGALGTIQGVTYLDGVPQSLVDIYIYDSYGRLIWSGKSQTIEDPLVLGYYEADLPPGDYTVTGQMRMADVLYRGQTVVTALASGEIRTMVDISLTSIE